MDLERPGGIDVTNPSETFKDPRFYTITSPMFDIPEVENPKLKVPETMHSRELELFKKECKLIGWEVKKHGRRNMVVQGEGESAFYRRYRKVWVRQGVYGFRVDSISVSSGGIAILPPSFRETIFSDPGPRF